MSDHLDIVKGMVDSILQSIEEAINKGRFDKTFTTSIIGKVSDNKAMVNYNGVTYTVNSTIEFNLGDIVRVCAPQNNFNDLFIVENKTQSYKEG